MMMSNKEKLIPFWGVCDLFFVVLYVAQNIFKGKIPLYSDAIASFNFSNSFGSLMPFMLTVLRMLLFISIIYSGLLLYRRNPAGAIIVYLQTPIRFITITPSLFFLLWPLRYIPKSIAIVIAVVMIIFTEAIKIWSIMGWRKSNLNAA